MKGYIKLWRKIMDTSFYKDSRCVHLALHLVMIASRQEKEIIYRGERVTLKQGQVITSRKKLSYETGLTEREVRTVLDLLTETGFITVKATNRFRLISVDTYTKYNAEEKKRPASDQQTTNRIYENPEKTTNRKSDIIINNKSNSEKEQKKTTNRKKIKNSKNAEKRPAITRSNKKKTKYPNSERIIYKKKQTPENKNKNIYKNENKNINKDINTNVYKNKNINTNTNKDINKYKNKNIYIEDFISFWKEYPRNVNKKGAFRCWKKQVDKNKQDPVILIQSAKNYAYYCDKNRLEERLIMHGTTFLGPDDRFEDYKDLHKNIKQSEKPKLLTREEILAEKRKRLKGGL